MTALLQSPTTGRSPYLAWLAIALVGGILTTLYIVSQAPIGYDITVAGAPYRLADGKDAIGIVAAPIVNGTADPTRRYVPARVTPSDNGAASIDIRLSHPGEVSVEVTTAGGKAYHNVQVEPLWRLLLAALLLLVLAIALPYGLGRTPPGQLGGPWYQLLSEAAGGYSLARIQLLAWFLPTAILYGALSLTLHAYVDVTPQIAVLLGLSGATTLLGTAATPQAAAGAAPVAPDLRDLVTDWNSHGDLSRYQYLLLSLVGATIMVAAFWRNVAMPDIPSQFLYLVAGSQATYVATKAVKTAALPSTPTYALPPASTATTVVAAPAIAKPAPPGTATDEGSFIPTPRGANG